MTGVNWVALTIVIILFVFVTAVGFAAARWRRAQSMASLDEWGLGGRGFGTFITWFLLGGDLYTAYTFIAVPAAMFATGAVSGFFAVPYTIIVYPIIFVFLPRLWSVSHRHGYVTPADFVHGRFGSRELSLAVAVTGILATMPYIALQLVGIQAVLEVVGIGGSDNVIAQDLPLFIAFAVLAAYTYSSGLRAPALIAFVKDALIYIVILVAVFYLPTQLGGWGHIFKVASDSFNSFNKDNADAIASGAAAPKAVVPPATAQWAYASLALGSALALFMYPHSVTGVLSTRDRSVIRRNAALLPAYTFLLGLLALLGFVAIAAGVQVTNGQQAVPQLFENEFPSWFAGVGFAAIAVGALVPAAIMSIAAANLFTRNIYRAYFRPEATPGEQRPSVEPPGVEADDDRGERLEDPHTPEQLQVDRERLRQSQHEEQRSDLDHERDQLADRRLLARARIGSHVGLVDIAGEQVGRGDRHDGRRHQSTDGDRGERDAREPRGELLVEQQRHHRVGVRLALRVEHRLDPGRDRHVAEQRQEAQHQ